MTETTGVVQALGRFPVKSMLAAPVDAVVVTSAGIVGDRSYAVFDVATGGVASAKHPKKWARLLTCEARYVDEPEADRPLPPVVVRLPDGTELRSDAPGALDRLSAFVGREVTLVTSAPDATYEIVWPGIDGVAPEAIITATLAESDVAPDGGDRLGRVGMGMAAPGTFQDVAPIHLLSASTLASLRALSPDSDFDVRRYRPNLLVDVDVAGFPENDWAGRTIAVGGVQLAGIMAAMRCVMTTLAHGDRPADRSTLQTIARHNRLELPGLGMWACAGAYLAVTEPGEIRVGDAVRVVDGPAPGA